MGSIITRYASLFFVILGVLAPAALFCQPQRTEELVLTTYYPVPYGDYQRLRLVPSTADATFVCDASSEGTMYYDAQKGQVLNCRRLPSGAYSWQAIGLWSSGRATVNGNLVDFIYPDSNDYSVVIGGNQLTGNYKLQVHGYAAANDVWLSNAQTGAVSQRWASDDTIQMVCENNTSCPCPSGTSAMTISTDSESCSNPWGLPCNAWWGWWGGQTITTSSYTFCVSNTRKGQSGGSTSCGGGGWGGGW